MAYKQQVVEVKSKLILASLLLVSFAKSNKCHVSTSGITCKCKIVLPSVNCYMYMNNTVFLIDRRDKMVLEHYDFLWKVMEENLNGVNSKK